MRCKTQVASHRKGGGATGAAAEAAEDGHTAAVRATADIVEELMRDPRASIFCRPVDPERDEEDFTMADYLEVISGPPMDLATVMRKFRGGAYPSAQVMREDVVRVWRNAYDFNGPDNPVYERALALSDRFDERFEALVAPPFHHLPPGLSAGDPSWLGRRVRVYWKGEHAFFAGSVRKADRVKGCYVVYEDGDEEWHKVPSVDVCLVDSDPPSLEQHVLLHHHRGLASLGTMYADEADAESAERLEHYARGAAHADDSTIAASSSTVHADAAETGAPSADCAPANAPLAKGLKVKPLGDNSVEPPRDKSEAASRHAQRHHPTPSGRHAANRGGRRHAGARRLPLPLRTRSGQGSEEGVAETSGRGAHTGRNRPGGRKSSRNGDASADDALHACAEALARLVETEEVDILCRPLQEADGDGHASVEWLEDRDLHLKAILARYRQGYYKTALEMRLHVIQLSRNCLILSGPDGALYGKARMLSGMFDGLLAQRMVAPARQGQGFKQDAECGSTEEGEALVGKAVSVYWPCDHEWYTATVVGHAESPLAGSSLQRSTLQGSKHEYLLQYHDGIQAQSWVQMPCVDVCLLERHDHAKGPGQGSLGAERACDHGPADQSARGKGPASTQSMSDETSGKGEGSVGNEALPGHPHGCMCGARRRNGGDAALLKVGTEVLARYHDGRWYPALVSDHHADGYLVDWRDGDTQDTVKQIGDVCVVAQHRVRLSKGACDSSHTMLAHGTSERSERSEVGWPPHSRKRKHAGCDAARKAPSLKEGGGTASHRAAAAMERNAGSRSDRLEGKEEAATRLDKAEAYSRVVGMTCQDVAQSLSGKDDLAAIVPLLLHHRLDGEGLLQLGWLLDPPMLEDGAEAQQTGGMPAFLRLARHELGIQKQALALRFAQHVRQVCEGAI